jgi:hypothetical protein
LINTDNAYKPFNVGVHVIEPVDAFNDNGGKPLGLIVVRPDSALVAMAYVNGKPRGESAFTLNDAGDSLSK